MKHRVLTVAERKREMIRRLPTRLALAATSGSDLDTLLSTIATEIVDMERGLLACMPDVKCHGSGIVDAPECKNCDGSGSILIQGTLVPCRCRK